MIYILSCYARDSDKMNNILKISIASVVICADQISKFYAKRALFECICPLLNISGAWNRGISFSLLSSNTMFSKYALVTLSIVLIFMIIKWIFSAKTIAQIGLCMMLGGAVGNLIDRIRYGAVFDFIQFHIGSWYFPTFNVADIFISVGVVIILLESVLCHIKKQRL